MHLTRFSHKSLGELKHLPFHLSTKRFLRNVLTYLKRQPAPFHPEIYEKSGLILFDDDCFFCKKNVQYLLKIDNKKLFCFAPLNGKTAKELLAEKPELQNKNSIILIENFLRKETRIWIFSKAIFRIFFLLGGLWKIIGILYLLPAVLIDPFYGFIAQHRHSLSSQGDADFIPKDRYFP